jgi:hypothetical protein
MKTIPEPEKRLKGTASLIQKICVLNHTAIFLLELT